MVDEIQKLLNKRLNKAITIIESAIPDERQVKAVRKLILDEFGEEGFIGDLKRKLSMARQG